MEQGGRPCAPTVETRAGWTPKHIHQFLPFSDLKQYV